MYCKHVYEEMKEDICPDCGRYTHRADWKFQDELHKEWISSGKAVSQGWYSI